MFTKTAKAIVQEDIANLEQITGYKLPQDFISQYITSNGGVPEKSLSAIQKMRKKATRLVFISQ